MSKSITYQVTVNECNTLWKLNGQFHREDGPAVEYASGSKEWYINDDLLTEDEFNQHTNPVVEMTIAEIEQLIGKRIKIVK